MYRYRAEVGVLRCGSYEMVDNALVTLLNLMGQLDLFKGKRILVKVNLIKGAPPEKAKEKSAPALIAVEKFINEHVSVKLKPNDKLVLVDGYVYLPYIEEYIKKYHFEMARCFKVDLWNVRIYKAVFKCTDNLFELKNSELKNVEKWRIYQCLLRKLY